MFSSKEYHYNKESMLVFSIRTRINSSLSCKIAWLRALGNKSFEPSKLGYRFDVNPSIFSYLQHV
jgi:hypothetical protein